jgi:hypothetical protein
VANALFAGQKKFKTLQVIRLGPMSQEATFIIDLADREDSGISRDPDYELVHVRLHQTADPRASAEGKSPERTITRIRVDQELVSKLKAMWQTMIRNARFPESQDVMSDGTTYAFETEFGIGPISAWIEGAAPAGCPGKLVRVGEDLARMADANPNDQQAIRSDLVRKLDALSNVTHR